MDNHIAVADEIWKDLIEASSVEPPLLIKPYCDEMVKKEEGEGTMVFVDFKKPSEMAAEDYATIVSKSNWNINIRYSLFSINKASEAVPIRLCHLLMHLAFKLKSFGNDAFRKVSSRCKVAANAVNHLLQVNTVFFPAGSVRAKIPLCVRPLNKETFKSAVVDLLKCTNDTNVQRFYVGDGDGNVEVAGLGIPPAALTDGVSPGAETLFKWSLHEVKALFESQTYLKNPNAAVAVAARQQAAWSYSLIMRSESQQQCYYRKWWKGYVQRRILWNALLQGNKS
jgi:hypothetical protein